MTQNTSPTMISSSTSHTCQRGDGTQPADYIQIQHAYNKRDADNPYNRKAVERALLMSGMLKSFPSEVPLVRSILDVGCREGFAVSVFENEFDEVRVVGVDIVPEFVKVASGVCDEIYEMDAHDLKFADGEFDYIFCSHTLEHCYNHLKALSEIKRVAAKGLYFVLPLEPASEQDHNHSHFFSTTDPLVWANLISDDDWMVTGVEMSNYCDVIITATQRRSLVFRSRADNAPSTAT